ncbi:MAG: prepilin-type N-terminal cleavage/methylation domain-containing protein [Methylobacter sp.]|jgi:type IV pilus assembly protein PilW|nr:prepilin-type N-terminal cleavage/methylation domain-containing protein [Methylobacter sp.]
MNKQTGFTLIELMIASLLGLIVVSATIAMYVGTVRASTDTLNSVHLNHDLDAVLSLITNDLKRAGYWGGAVIGADSLNNPFTLDTANIQAPAASCILYSYDADGDGVVDADEFYGFRLNGSNIDIRLSGTTTADCADGTWSAMTTEGTVNVTALTFATTYKCLNVTTTLSYNTPCADVTAGNLATGEKAVESRRIDIALTGQLVNDTTVTKTLTDTIKVRADRVFIQP